MVAAHHQVATMFSYKGIIALDLDGTLLNSKKELSSVNYKALEDAYNNGWAIVPTTGRFYDAMPKIIKELPFVDYAITINGAEIKDLKENKVLYKAEIPLNQAIDIMKFLDDYPLIYDCFMGGEAFMSGNFKKQIDEMASNLHYRKMLHELRKEVLELKDFILDKNKDIQKIQFFTNKPELRLSLMKEIPNVFNNLIVSSSVVDNVEINNIHANKGDALLELAKYLNVSSDNVIAFGDGLNDLTMLEKAGIGIVMDNASEEVKKYADYITLSCDDDGVAYGIRKFCFK